MTRFSELDLGGKYSRKRVSEILGEPTLGHSREGVFYCKNSPDTILLVDLEKDDKKEDDRFNDYFDGEYFHWDSQLKQHLGTDKIQEIVNGDVTVHLLVRRDQKIKSRTQPFIYCGRVQYESHVEGSKNPVHIIYRNVDYDDFTDDDDLIEVYLWKPEVSGKTTTNPRERKSPSTKRRKSYKKPSRTERQGLVTSRVGQGWYRREVVEKWMGRCPVTGSDLKQVLISSHIVSWSDSTDDERLDPENGILLSPNVDSLFDRHLISFGDDGSLLVSDRVSDSVLESLGIPRGITIPVTEGMKSYLGRHRDRVSGEMRVI